MNKKLTAYRIRLALLGLLAVVVSPAASADIVSDRTETIDQLLIYSGSNATLEAGGGKNVLSIRFKPEAIQLLGLLPQVFSSDLSMADHLHVWDGLFAYERSGVPALLTWSDQNGQTGVRVWISNPSYDSQNRDLVFTIRKAQKITKTLESLAVSKKKWTSLAPGTLSGVNLYLDDQTGRVLRYTSAQTQTVDTCLIQPYATCRNASLAGADLKGASLIRADLSGTDLSGTNLDRTDMTMAVLNNTNFAGAHMEGTGLYGASVSSSNFDGAYMLDANLSYGQWWNMALVQTNLAGARLEGTALNGVTFCSVIMPDGTVNNSGCN